MRTPKLHYTTAGEPYWRVRYVKADGVQRALAFHGDGAQEQAERFAAILDRHGPDRGVRHWNALLAIESDAGLTLDEWFPRYLRSLTNVTPGTRIGYDRTYRRVWQQPLGRLPLELITREDIADVVNALSARKADKTVRNAFGVLSSCLKAAALDGLIEAAPTRGIKLPRRTDHQATEMRFLDHDEWARLHAALPAHYRPLFTFLVGTGARWGEAEALQVGDVLSQPITRDGVTVDRWVVRITKAAKWNASKATREVGPTKTRKSKRTITLPPEVVDELSPLLDRPKTARLFLAPKGGELRHRTTYDEWKKAVERAGLDPQPRIHDLRHTHVAWLIAAGRSLPVIQARLGHEQITTTIDRYGHLLPELDYEAAEAASSVMRRAVSGGSAPGPAAALPPAGRGRRPDE